MIQAVGSPEPGLKIKIVSAQTGRMATLFNQSVIGWIERLLLKRYTWVSFPVRSNERL